MLAHEELSHGVAPRVEGVDTIEHVPLCFFRVRARARARARNRARARLGGIC